MKYYIYLQLGILIWLYTIGQCTLTGLEYKLRTGKDNYKSAEQEDAPGGQKYIKVLIHFNIFLYNLKKFEFFLIIPQRIYIEIFDFSIKRKVNIKVLIHFNILFFP